MEQTDLLEMVGEILDKLEIPYFVTGGMAVVVWGRPRFTADIDLVVGLVPQKLDRLAAELLKIDKYVYVDQEVMAEALKTHGEFNFIDSTSGLKVDFWVLKNDPYSRKQMERRVAKDINGKKIYFASPEDLILNKLLWYKDSKSTRHLEDIESIIKVQENLDTSYLQRQSESQSTFEFLQPLLNNSKI